MCYGSFCGYEDSRGECCKPRRAPCPLEYPDGDDGRDSLCDDLYEMARDDALMEEGRCSLS